MPNIAGNVYLDKKSYARWIEIKQWNMTESKRVQTQLEEYLIFIPKDYKYA